jgi:L,D-transpeptidase YbiS
MKIRISVKNQTLTYSHGDKTLVYPVSTALNGTGETKGSNQTPLGEHIIRAKIGGECPSLAVFVGRRWTGEIYSTQLAAQEPNRDWILTRILWLSGIELGKNRGGSCDTMRRYIYIHGTSEEDQIGQPVSQGCIRMRNKDVLSLYDLVTPGTPVIIVI